NKPFLNSSNITSTHIFYAEHRIANNSPNLQSVPHCHTPVINLKQSVFFNFHLLVFIISLQTLTSFGYKIEQPFPLFIGDSLETKSGSYLGVNVLRKESVG